MLLSVRDVMTVDFVGVVDEVKELVKVLTSLLDAIE